MSEFDDIEGYSGSPCVFARAMAQVFDPDDRRALEEAVAGEYMHTTIGKWLEKRGIMVKINAIGLHRRGGCSCEGLKS